MGYQTAVGISSGNNNIGMGTQALMNGSGSNNIAIGYQTSFNGINSPNNNNISLGYQTMYNLLYGIESSNNIGLGYQTLYNLYGSNNIAFGYQALYGLNQSGSTGVTGNISIGNLSSKFITSGVDNIAIGNGSRYNAPYGDENICIGIGSGASCKSSSNIGIGRDTCNYINNNCNTNIGIGINALAGGATLFQGVPQGVTGSYNIAMGTNSLASLVEGDYNIGIGDSCFGIPTGISNIGIGDSSLSYTLNVGSYNLSFGSGSGIGVGGGSPSQVSIFGSDQNNFNISIGRSSGPASSTYSDTVSIGTNAQATGSRTMVLGNIDMTVKTTSAIVITSDARDKIDINDISLGLDFINRLRPVNYKMNFRESYKDFIKDDNNKITVIEVENDGSRKRTRIHNGFLAQDIKNLIDETGEDFAGYQDASYNGGMDRLGLAYNEFIAPMVKAIQELSIKVNQLNIQNQQLNDIVQQLLIQNQQLREDVDILKNK